MSSFQALILSLAIHVALTLFAYLWESPSQDWVRIVPIELTYETPEESTAQQFVTNPEPYSPEVILENLKRQADFLSETTRRVQEEMAARNSGETRNRARSGTDSSEPTQARQQAPQQSSPRASELKPSAIPNPRSILDSARSESTIETRPSISGAPSETSRRVTLSPSTLSEHIPSVREGGFTSLNTDQFLYYTFYARINEQLRNRWVFNLRQFVSQSGPQRINRLAQRPQITEIEVILDADGNYVKSTFHNHADDPAIDKAAQVAFQQASPFLNPPSEIVTEEGFIHLHYSFHVLWRPQYVANDSR